MTLNILTLQKEIGDGNAKRGFHEENDRLKEAVQNLAERVRVREGIKREAEARGNESLRYQDSVTLARSELVEAVANLRNYQITKIALIVTEAAEAVEELRHGHTASETYYPTQGAGVNLGGPLKPEGVPSEIADIVIRCFDFADEAGFDLFAMIEEKLAYNETRGFRHGGKAV